MIELSRKGAIATVTLARAPVNAINEELMAALHGALDTLADSDCKVLHLRSNQKAFAAGADIALMSSFTAATGGDRAMDAYVKCIQALYQRIETLPQVSIAEIGGAALGGGFELALACDLRIAAAEAKLGLPEVGIGLIPAAGGTQRLTRLCGRGIASRLILGAEVIDGVGAEKLGLVQWCVPRADLAQQALALAERFAAMPAAALRAAKACIAVAQMSGTAGYDLEQQAACDLLASRETADLLAAFLAGKR